MSDLALGDKHEDQDDPAKERLLADFIKNQAQELELKRSELIFEQQRDNNQFEIAKLSIAASAEDRKDHRAVYRQTQRDRLRFILWALFGLIALVGACLGFGHKDVALEIVKAAVFLAAGAAGGYGAARSRAKPEDRQDDPPQ